MLSPTAQTIRLFLHVTAAAVWIGGQVVMAGLVPVARRQSADLVKVLARGFARVAWPAFAVLLVTGIWNLMSVHFSQLDSAAQITLFVKIFLGVLAGMFAAVHAVGRTRLALAVGGGLALACSLGALFLGVLARTGH